MTLLDFLGLTNMAICGAIMYACFCRIRVLNPRDYQHRFAYAYMALAVFSFAEAIEPFAAPYWQPYIMFIRGIEAAVWPTPFDVLLNASVMWWLWASKAGWEQGAPEFMRVKNG